MQQNKDRQATELSALILFGVVINSLVYLEILQSIEYCLIIFFPDTSMESHESFLNEQCFLFTCSYQLNFLR